MATATETVPRSRDLARTRRQLLDAARVEVQRRGVGVSLDAIAAAAGVSKGGLLHHFRTKDELLVGLAGDLYSRFEERVDDCLAKEPDTPGRLARAYVRATFAELAEPDLHSHHAALLTLLSTVPSVSELINEKLAGWEQALADDPQTAGVVRLVMFGCDGVAVSMMLNPAVHRPQLAELQRQLLALIDVQTEVAALLATTMSDTHSEDRS